MVKILKFDPCPYKKMWALIFNFNPLYMGDLQMGTFTDSEDPDEMLHNAAFHQGLHCLLR